MRIEGVAISSGGLRSIRITTYVVVLLLGGNMAEWPYFDELLEQEREEVVAQSIDSQRSLDDEGAATSTRDDSFAFEVLLGLRLMVGRAAAVVDRAGFCADFPAVVSCFHSRFPEVSSRPPPVFGL